MQHPQNQNFSVLDCHGTIIYHNCDEVTVQGKIEGTVTAARIRYRAANPIDKRSSLSGSGLPFVNAQQAFENSPNIEEIELNTHNTFSIDLLMPNSYYIGLGTVLVPPSLFIDYHNGSERQTLSIVLNNPLPYKSLTYPISKDHASRSSSLFYDVSRLPSRSQEEILYDSAYPCAEPMHKALPVNFWGAKPPQ